MGSWLTGVENGAFASDVFTNKLDHKADCILCKRADDTMLRVSALHAGRQGSFLERA